MYIFETDGDYVNFNGGANLWRLHKNSRVVSWHWDESGDLFFDVYDQQYQVKAADMGTVTIGGVTLATAADFETNIKLVFPGLAGGGTSYLVYIALLNQTGTDAPVPTVLQNTLGGAIIWTYNSQGLYIGTLNGAFPTGKVAIFFGNTFSGEYAYAGDINSAPDSIYVNPYQYNGATFQWDPSNGILVNTPINILVFQ